MRRLILATTTVSAMIGLAVAANAAAASIKGRLTTKEKDSVVEISACGAAMCGRVS